MNEQIFLSTIGNESNLRIFETLRQRGESSMYMIARVTGLDREIIRPHLHVLRALGLVDSRTGEGEQRNCTCTYWKMNLANSLMQRLVAVLDAIHDRNGTPRPW